MPRGSTSHFVTVTKEEFESWLAANHTSFEYSVINDERAQEYVYEVMNTSASNHEEVCIRIYSSVDKRTGVTRERGKDAIRLVYWDKVNNVPIGAGRKLLRTESARSSLKDRFMSRLASLFGEIQNIHPVDFAYVQYVLEQCAEHYPTNNFAGSLLQQITRSGSLSSKQVAYVVGEENPSGHPTLEARLLADGHAPRIGYDLRAAHANVSSSRPDGPFETEGAVITQSDTMLDLGDLNVTIDSNVTIDGSAPRSVNTDTLNATFVNGGATARWSSDRPNMQETPRDLLNRIRQVQQADHILPVTVEEESDRMVDDLDNFLSENEPAVEEIALVATSNYDGHQYGFEYFNPVQSEVYNRALDHEGNLIVAANTSSGKTVCAEMMIDKALEIGHRAVYLSPLKSLTQEKYADWRRRWPDEKIVILTGDYVLSEKTKRDLHEASIIVMTSEMCDSRTRRMRREGNEWLFDVGVFVVDEAHILTTERGHAVETGIMRFTKLNRWAQVVLLSATMPNVDQLGEWLTLLNGMRTVVVKSNWRPVQLEINYPAYTPEYFASGRFDYHSTQTNKKELAVRIVQSKPNEKFLVFVHDKNTGRGIVRMLQRKRIEAHFHNADLNLEDRLEIEKKFENRDTGSLRVLVSTSTLAWGRNLPARNVVIVGNHRGISEVDPLDFIQMAGRAGRYGIDDAGSVYFLTASGTESRNQELMENPRQILSVLSDRQTIAFHMLAEMQNGVIVDRASFKTWYARSFAAITLPRVDDEFIEEVFNDMIHLEMIKKKSRTRYRCTMLGNVSAWLYYSPYDIAAWHHNFGQYFTRGVDHHHEDLALAWALAKIPSLDYGYCPPDAEEQFKAMKVLLADASMGLEPGNATHTAAAWAMIQGEETPQIMSVAVATRTLRFDLDRMLHAIRLIDKKHAQWGADWKVIHSRIKYGIGEELVELVSIKGVGAKRAQKLYDAGLSTVAQVASLSGKKKMLRIFPPAMVTKINVAAKQRKKRR